MQANATDIETQQSLCVYGSGHNRVLCKNNQTNQDAVWVVDSPGHKEPSITWSIYGHVEYDMGTIW